MIHNCSAEYRTGGMGIGLIFRNGTGTAINPNQKRNWNWNLMNLHICKIYKSLVAVL